MKFHTVELSAEDIDQAIEDVRNGRLSSYVTPSDTTYIRCRQTAELWDFKPVVGKAIENAGVEPHSFGWVTTRFQPPVIALGFWVYKFKSGRGRTLGLRGFDRRELSDQFEVLRQDNFIMDKYGFEQRNHEDEQLNEPPDKQKSISSRYIRNSQIANKIRQESSGYCDACNSRSFQTKSDSWFIEVHHKKWLREGGTDTIENLVALCPTCHRAEHHGKIRKYK